MISTRRGMRAAALAATLLSAWSWRMAAAAPKDAAPPRVLVAPFAGVISPVAAEFLGDAVENAEKGKYDALVIQLDTPGGLDTSMRTIVQAILNAKVPVIVYVHPSGGRAASAGVFITMAAHVAAMAPGTNIGAAHPVMIPTSALPGEKQEKTQDKALEGKVVNDASAYLRSIARERGRNEEWAALAVTQSTSIPAMEAVRLRVVDLSAASLEELLKAADGREIPALKAKLRSAGATVERVDMTRRQRWLATISDPNVAMILMSLGGAGLLIELYNPGLILPGIVGAISLILAFYSFQTLAASYAGILLILLGLLLFILEIKLTSYGMLGLGAVTSMLLGILMLFQRQAAWGLQVSWSIALSTVGGFAALTAVYSYIVYHAFQRKVMTGAEALIGAQGAAVSALSPRGKVRIQGELWDAVAAGDSVPEGAAVVVESMDGLTLTVRRA